MMHEGMNRIDAGFASLAREGRKALIPYLTAGYPDLDTTAAILERVDGLGVPMVELGIPFSDSIADGPVIQNSFHRVLEAGFRVDDALSMVAGVRDRLRCGVLAMVSMSIVRRRTVRRFVDHCRESGFDGLIVPDVPLEEAPEVIETANEAGLRSVMLIAPSTPPGRRERIAGLSSGFIYQVAVRGITGERDKVPDEVVEFVRRLKEVSKLPVCVGFGIGSPDQVRAVCSVADGAIVGSAIVRRITEGIDAGEGGEQVAQSVTEFVEHLLTGTGTR